MQGSQTAIVVAAAALLGLAIGSFGGVVASRLPSGTSVVSGRSRCDTCLRPLAPHELVPVVSWIALRGRCGSCGSPIPARWALIEIATSTGFVTAALVAADPWQAVSLAGLLAVLPVLTAIDLEHRRLPNAIVYPAAACSAAWIVAARVASGALDPVGAAIGSIGFGGCLLVVAVVSRGGMGLGDVKLAGLIGLVVGAVDLPSVAVAAGTAIVLGGIAGLIALARGAGRRDALPFGPMLAVGAFVAVVAGRPIADAYVGLLR